MTELQEITRMESQIESLSESLQELKLKWLSLSIKEELYPNKKESKKRDKVGFRVNNKVYLDTYFAPSFRKFMDYLCLIPFIDVDFFQRHMGNEKGDGTFRLVNNFKKVKVTDVNVLPVGGFYKTSTDSELKKKHITSICEELNYELEFINL